MLLLCPRRRLSSRIIAALRADGKLTVAIRPRVDFHLAISALTFRCRRFVSNRVLGANIMGHGAADGVNFVQCLREEGDSASSIRDDLQRPFSMLRMLFLLQYTNRLNRRPILG